MVHAGVYSAVHALPEGGRGRSGSDDGTQGRRQDEGDADRRSAVRQGQRSAIDGRKIHPAYLVEAKKPAESKGEWDLYKIRATIPAEQAFRPLADGGCPLVK